jgi:hypothetical protein
MERIIFLSSCSFPRCSCFGAFAAAYLITVVTLWQIERIASAEKATK